MKVIPISDAQHHRNRCCYTPLGIRNSVAGTDYEALMWALGLLCIPLVMALPARFAWRIYTGSKIEHGDYRKAVKQVLDSGYSLEQFRVSLNDERRRLHIEPEKARLIETDVLYPLSLPHFLLLPALIVSPLAILLAIPMIIMAIPILLLLDWLLIEKRGLIMALLFLQRRTKWQIIHISQPHRTHGDLREAVVSFHRIPRASFLGMFAWLMVHWSLAAESIWLEMLVSGILYLALLAVIEVVSNALDAELVFADPAGSRLVPVDKWMQAFVEPLIGAGLIFLLWRDLMQESRLSGGDPVLFALTALFVLFAVAVVGLGVEIGFSRRRGKKTQMVFSNQVVEEINPLSYTFTRHSGRLELNVSCSMAETVERRQSESKDTPRKQLDFAFVEKLRSKAEGGPITPPQAPATPLDISAVENSAGDGGSAE